MADLPAYEREPYRTELPTEVVRTGIDGGRPYAVLADTILYPEGGGQPSDRGRIGAASVLDVQKRSGEVRHVLAAPVEPGPVTVSLDWERRFDHMQQHTGQHLLTAVAQDLLGWPTTAFHLGEKISDIELGVPSPPADRLARLEQAVAAEIRAARPVSGRRVPREALERLGVRTRGLPEDFEGDVRLVEIGGVDLNTCGGTHLRSTAELETVKLLGTESLRGGTRLFFVFGGRARRRLGEHEARSAALRSLLGAPDEGLVTAAETKLEQLRAAEKRVRDLETELCAALAETLAARQEAPVSLHLDGRDLAFLQALARAFVSRAPGKSALLTASTGEGSFFAVAAGNDVPLDVQAVGRRIAVALGGRGGGSGRVFQGKAPDLVAREAALALLASA